MSTKKGKVRIFACGGCGTNIANAFEEFRGKSETGFGDLDVIYIDTSRSNLLNKKVDDNHCFLIEGLDGSGKIRSENYEEISKRARAILQTHQPADLNVVVFSASGGSGSVIGPLLMREMLIEGIPAIAMVVGSTDTTVDAKNTLNTLKSMDSISKKIEIPMVAMYLQNSATTPRNQVDGEMYNSIKSLAILYSRENVELDTQDLFNWLRYNRVTKVPVKLISLNIICGDQKLDASDDIVSVATLAMPGDSTSLQSMPDYQCVGYLPDGVAEVIKTLAPIHFVIADGEMQKNAGALDTLVNSLEKRQAARVDQGNIVKTSDNTMSDGMVF